MIVTPGSISYMMNIQFFFENDSEHIHITDSNVTVLFDSTRYVFVYMRINAGCGSIQNVLSTTGQRWCERETVRLQLATSVTKNVCTRDTIHYGRLDYMVFCGTGLSELLLLLLSY